VKSGPSMNAVSREARRRIEERKASSAGQEEQISQYRANLQAKLEKEQAAKAEEEAKKSRKRSLLGKLFG